MKKTTSILTLVLPGIIVAGAVLTGLRPTLAQDKPNSKPMTYEDAILKEGKNVFLRQCKSCHGPKGLGNGPKAASLENGCKNLTEEETQSQSDDELVNKLKKGGDEMPVFNRRISDEVMWAVIQYVRTLKAEEK